MDEEPKSLCKGMGRGRRYLRRCLFLLAAIFLILLTVTQFLPGGRRSFSDWIPALLFLFAVSLAAAATILGVCVSALWLCCRRNIKRLSFAGAGVIALMALFYAEEDWRGWYAWNRFKHKWEAKGETFDLASVAPPTVAAEKNFAMTAIAFTSYGHILIRDGKTIPPEKRDPNFVQRMRMSILHDYPGPTNCTGDRVRGTMTKLDCWQSYEGKTQSHCFRCRPRHTGVMGAGQAAGRDRRSARERGCCTHSADRGCAVFRH